MFTFIRLRWPLNNRWRHDSLQRPNSLTKVLRVFLLAIHSHLYSFDLRILFLQTHTTSYSFYSSVAIHCKEERRESWYCLPYGLRNPYIEPQVWELSTMPRNLNEIVGSGIAKQREKIQTFQTLSHEMIWAFQECRAWFKFVWFSFWKRMSVFLPVKREISISDNSVKFLSCTKIFCEFFL